MNTFSLQFVSIESGTQHMLLVNNDGRVLAFGHNDSGQCGHDGLTPIMKPTMIDHLNDFIVVQIACGLKHSLFLTNTGEVFGCGNNECGQLGIGNQHQAVAKPQKVMDSIRKIGCGQTFSVLLDVDGNLHTFGSSERGQLGYNTNAECEYLPKVVTSFKSVDGAVKSMYGVKIVDFSCGLNHTV